jgi:hypothetical protein
MKKLICPIVVGVSSLLWVSCQKEVSQEAGLGSKDLQGNWKFIGMYSKTESIVELTDGIDSLKTVTQSEYNSIENTGTLKIDGSNMTSNGFGYTVDTKAKGFVYENNVLVDTISAPFNFVLPSTSMVSPYVRINTDSIYFSGDQFINIAASTSLAQPTGVKLTFDGDKLLMNVNVAVSDTQNVVGIQQITRETVKGVVTYQKL